MRFCCLYRMTIKMIEVGMIHEVSAAVTNEKTAVLAGSGSLPVFATPYMVALMEQAAAELCQKELTDGKATVGIMINTSHLAATPVGMDVKAVAKVTAVDRRKISFEVEAYDNAGLIGKGTHDRFIIDCEQFMQKAQERKES